MCREWQANGSLLFTNSWTHAKANGFALFFLFVHWYNRKGRSSFGRHIPAGYTLVEKWDGNSEMNLPLVPSAIVERVMVQHYCVRTCSRNPVCRNPLSCNCNIKCRLQEFCLEHQVINCIDVLCASTQKTMVDVHHKDINEYLLLDVAAGFETDL